MKKRAERSQDLPQSCGNVRYYGLAVRQVVWVQSHPDYTGPAVVHSDPPQGPGVYVVTANGKRMLVSGENITQATEPTL